MNVTIRDASGIIVFSNLKSNCHECAAQCVVRSVVRDCEGGSAKRRSGFISDATKSIYICTDDSDLVNSNRMFKNLLDTLWSILPDIMSLRNYLERDANTRSLRLIHNLKTLNAHSMQEIYAIVAQESLSHGSYSDQVDLLSSIIYNNPRKAALAILNVIKHNLAMRCEFGSFAKLHGDKARLSLKVHPVRRVVLNTLHTFFADFTDKNVYVNVEQNTDSVTLDYESFQVALFHIIDNAAKYVASNTILNVRFQEYRSKYGIIFEMTSIAITDVDFANLYNDGYSSEMARKASIAGDGLGMGVVRDLMILNGGDVRVQRDIDPKARMTASGMNYTRNIFELLLPYGSKS